MRTLKISVLTPDGPVFEGEGTAIQVPGTQGSFQVLLNHAPIISTLAKGKLKIDGTTDGTLLYNVEGGVVEVLNNTVVVLAQKALAS